MAYPGLRHKENRRNKSIGIMSCATNLFKGTSGTDQQSISVPHT